MNELLELINAVKLAAPCNEVELWGSKRLFDELMASGFPLTNFKHREFELDDSKIIIVPCEPKPIKLYFAGDDH